MEKIKFITDSASDIPAELAQKYNIQVLPIPITIDGKGYLERQDFTPSQFYQMVLDAESIPTTSHIPHTRYAEVYRHAALDGYTHVINITINAKGSNMYNAAVMGIDLFREDEPELAEKLKITVIDSQSYTYTYGYAVVQGAKMAEEGKSAEEILDWINDYFSRVETYFAVLNLDFAKKSGRISAAAAFVGEVLGLRPIMTVSGGEIRILEKVRGDRNVIPKMLQIATDRRKGEKSPFIVMHTMHPEHGRELEKGLVKACGKYCAGDFEIGASITINAGPTAFGCIVMGEKRE